MLRAVTAAAWCAAALMLVMLWAALLGVGWSSPFVFIGWGAACIAGFALIARAVPSARQAGIGRPTWADRFGVNALALIAAAIVFNGAFWPFSRPDALGIYRPAALAMWQTGTLEPLIGAESLYRTYPVGVPLLYTAAYVTSGWENEYAAKALSSLLAVGSLAAVALLGQEVGGRRTGLLAALLLAWMPAFPRWASSGYVDLPMAFYFTLAALFTARFWRTGKLVDALLAGVMVGVAAFVKNAGLLAIALVIPALLAAPWWAAPTEKRWPRLGYAVAGALCALAIAGPWYVRNLFGAGVLIPATAWTDQAERSLRTLAIYITLPDNFALSGWAVVLGLIFALRWIAAGGLSGSARSTAGPLALLLWLTLPFFAAWWLFVSYDPRFLLLFTPILCVPAAFALEATLGRLTAQQRLRAAAWAVAAALTAYSAWLAVEYKLVLVRTPQITHEEKIALVRPIP